MSKETLAVHATCRACAQSAIWEEYKREAEQLDERFQAVLDDRRQKRTELVRPPRPMSPSLPPMAAPCRWSHPLSDESLVCILHATESL